MARELRRPISGESAIGRAATRRARPVPGTAADHVRALEARYGREGARERLGVSERTMRRWRAGGRPSQANAERITREARLSPRREARLRNRGARVRMSGNLGLPDKKYRRHRTVEVDLEPEQMGEILDAWKAGDDEGALDALREALGENYLRDFTFEDLTRLEFLRREVEE